MERLFQLLCLGICGSLAMGDLSLVLYAPLINPLTQKTIGPDRERPKSLLRFSKWEGTEAEVFIATDNLPYSPGDVLAGVHVILGGTEPNLLSLDTPHRWWMLAPEPLPDASDISKMPTVAENEKRRAEATAAAEKSAKENQAALAKQAAESFKKPPVTAPKKDANWITPFSPMDEQLQPAIYANLTDEDKADVREFLVKHHEKVSAKQLKEAVEDYASEVDHFANGRKTREWILENETTYHGKFTSVSEKVRPDSVEVTVHRGNGVDVEYIMDSIRVKPDGTREIGSYRVSLWLAKYRSPWRIARHTAKAIK